MARVLVTANDVISRRLAGPGIRCVELGRQLALAGHDVTIVGIDSSETSFEGGRIVGPASVSGIDALAKEHDAILIEGLSLVRYPSLQRAQIPLIVDLYDPFPLAVLEQESHASEASRDASSRQLNGALADLLSCGDFFICASERQRDFWLGALLRSGRVNPRTWDEDQSLRKLIDVVPFGVSDSPPPTRQSGDRAEMSPQLDDQASVLLWAGGIYNWFDPLILIRAVARLAPQHNNLRLVFMSTTHPNPGVPGRMWMPQRARELAAQLGVSGTAVLFHDGWVPYESRGRWLAAADCGVSIHFDHAETRYAFRTRILDYLWARLPIICSDGDYFADLVRERELGWVVPPGDEDALTEAVRSFAQRNDDYEKMRARVGAVAGTMTWSFVTRPLIAYCEQLTRAADLPRVDNRPAQQRAPERASLRAAWRLIDRGTRMVFQSGPQVAARETKRWWSLRNQRVKR
jgi:glycosyltransferase involved in cell wall biosynthesis